MVINIDERRRNDKSKEPHKRHLSQNLIFPALIKAKMPNDYLLDAWSILDRFIDWLSIEFHSRSRGELDSRGLHRVIQRFTNRFLLSYYYFFFYLSIIFTFSHVCLCIYIIYIYIYIFIYLFIYIFFSCLWHGVTSRGDEFGARLRPKQVLLNITYIYILYLFIYLYIYIYIYIYIHLYLYWKNECTLSLSIGIVSINLQLRVT